MTNRIMHRLEYAALAETRVHSSGLSFAELDRQAEARAKSKTPKLDEFRRWLDDFDRRLAEHKP